MLINPIQHQAAEECLKRYIPFAVYAMPWSEQSRFMACVPHVPGHSEVDITEPGDAFFISRFGADEPYMAGVRAAMDEAELLDLLARQPDLKGADCQERPSLTSTRRISYDEAFKVMHARLKKFGGKVVLSRHESLFSNRDIVDVADEYFKTSPRTFRYLSFTPENGVWLGATPELILEWSDNIEDIKWHTMALAGTRPAGETGEWDDKNIQEHKIVAEFIADTLRQHGIKVTLEPMCNLTAGPVMHLCTPIYGFGHVENPMDVLADLNPTPAVCGWPTPLAMAEIDTLETHQRRCYAGMVGVREGDRIRAFVNLRCAFAAQAFIATPKIGKTDGWIYNTYAGGGIMADSDVAEEWAETERKMSALIKCIEGNPEKTKLTVDPIKARFKHLKSLKTPS